MHPEQTSEKYLRLEDQLQILNRANRELNAELSLNTIRKILVAHAMQLVNASAGAVGIFENHKMIFREYFRGDEKINIYYAFESGQGIPGWVIDHKAPYISLDAANDSQVIAEIQQGLNFANLINIPLLDHNNNLLGCIELHNKQDGEQFGEHDIEVLQGLVSTAAIAIRNARIIDQKTGVQAELYSLKERYRELVESTCDWLWEVDHNGRYTYVSPKLESLLGYQPSEVIGQTPFDLMPADEAERVQHIFVNQILPGRLMARWSII